MGQGAEDADIAYEMIEARGIDPEVYYGTKRKRSSVSFSSAETVTKPKGRTKKDNTVHRPTTDAAAKELILKLDHFEWDTHKVSGRFDRNPYTLTAKINGVPHKIKLAGRFGGVLKWLDLQERKRYEQTQESI